MKYRCHGRFSRPFAGNRFPTQIKNAFRVCDKRKAERQQINALASGIIVVNSQNGVHKTTEILQERYKFWQLAA
jgi:hypothetical protein